MPDQDGLVARIRQLRRTPAATGRTPGAGEAGSDSVRIQALEARMAELEEMVEGFQDSVYRESRREDKRITDLEAKVDPAAIAAALSRDARERGL